MGAFYSSVAGVPVPTEWRATTDEERDHEAQDYADTLFRSFQAEMIQKPRSEMRAYMKRWKDLEHEGYVYGMTTEDQATYCDEVCQRLVADLPPEHLMAMARKNTADAEAASRIADAASVCNIAALLVHLPDSAWKDEQLAKHRDRCVTWAVAVDSGIATTN